MTAFTAIDLSRLPAPDILRVIDAEATLAGILAAIAAVSPELAESLAFESDPHVKLSQVLAYALEERSAEWNDQVKGMLLAYSRGTDLDGIAAALGTARLTVVPADPDAIPPVPAVVEGDDALRRRAQLSLEALSVAGPEGAYIAHALGADGRVKDASVASPSPGVVVLTILSRLGDGRPAGDLLPAVAAALEDARPVTDHLTVRAADVVNYAVSAAIEVPNGPTAAPIVAAARAAAAAYAARQHGLGRDVARSALFAALHQAGVERVRLEAPAADIVVPADAAPWCLGIDLRVERLDG